MIPLFVSLDVPPCVALRVDGHRPRERGAAPSTRRPRELRGVLREVQAKDPKLATELAIAQTALGAEVSPGEPVVRGLAAAHQPFTGATPK
jgi:hypothetical protein